MKAVMKVNCGKVFVGDICYALDDKIYDEVWGKKMQYKDGILIDNNTIYAMTHSTKYGDGGYVDSKDHYYPVDAGNIGVVNLDYEREVSDTEYGCIVESKTDKISVEETYNDGVIHITIWDGYDEVIYDEKINTNLNEIMRTDMYIVKTINISNGFEYPELSDFMEKSQAEELFRKLVAENKPNYQKEEITLDNNTCFFANENNTKGNGITIELLSEDMVLSEIEDEVNLSKETIDYNIDSNIIECNVLYLNECGEITCEDMPEGAKASKPNMIVRRPYYPEGEYIYDVYLDIENKEDGSTIEYVESIEVICFGLLKEIYLGITKSILS